MVIVGHMSSKSAFGAKNTGQKFLTPKNFRGRGGPGRPGAAISPGAGAGRAGRASLILRLVRLLTAIFSPVQGHYIYII